MQLFAVKWRSKSLAPLLEFRRALAPALLPPKPPTPTMLRFDVNVSMLWRELPFIARLQKAATAGFDTVEFLWPRGENLDEIAGAIQELRLSVALHNMDAGDIG